MFEQLREETLARRGRSRLSDDYTREATEKRAAKRPAKADKRRGQITSRAGKAIRKSAGSQKAGRREASRRMAPEKRSGTDASGGGRREVPDAPARPPRYANAALLEPEAERALNPSQPLAPGQLVRLRLDIGPWSPESQIERPEPIDERLPQKDLWLDVVLSSTHFTLGTSRRLGTKTAVRGRFFLPADGSQASTPKSDRYLYFFLRAPLEVRTARARVTFYYRDAVVQSLLLAADVRADHGGFKIEVDYSLSRSLTDLTAIPAHRRFSIVVNDNTDGTDQLLVRGRLDGRRRIEVSHEIGTTAIGEIVAALRGKLRQRAPERKRRPKQQLKQDLMELAPIAWKLHAALWSGIKDLRIDPTGSIIHVARPVSSSFTFPWSLLYDIPLDRDAVKKRQVPYCPVVERWDGRSPLVEGSPRSCPAAEEVPHDRGNLYCPFGFWGYRHAIELLTSREDIGAEIAVPEEFSMVVAKTRRVALKHKLEAHLASLRETLQSRFAGAEFREGSDKETIRTLLGQDLPLVYFYCHGEREAGDPHTYLGVGTNETIAAEDFIGWVKIWQEAEQKRIWDRIRPLIFINACHSVEVLPETLISYQDAFIGGARAAGIIGTEVKVHQGLALEFAANFFRLFIGRCWTVDRSLHQARIDFLADGNLFGLVYTPYCWANLQLIAEA